MPAIREILLVPHTHHDIGYTNTPRACLEGHERGIYDVLDLCEAGLDDNAPDAFRWTVEIARPLVQFLRHAPARDVERLRRLVERGRISVTAGYLHMTQLIGHEDYVRFFLPVREMRGHGLPVSIVQHADVNGLSWGAVPVMVEAGLDCLVMGLNPDHGLPPLEQPSAFHWEGQDGSRVFVWLSSHYGHCDDWGITGGRIEPAVAPIADLIAHTEARDDYPFDFLLLHAAQDNLWPNNRATEAVRRWNERSAGPPMRTVTIDAAMQQAREQAARANLPTLRGEWADWWAHGHGSSAYEVGVARQAQSDLRAAETIEAMSRLNWAHLAQRAQRHRGHRDFVGGLAATPASGPSPDESSVASAPSVSPALNTHVPEPHIPPDKNVPVIAWYRRPSRQVTDPDRQGRTDATYDNLLLFEEHTWGSFDSVERPHGLFARAHWNAKAQFAYNAAGEARALCRESVERLLASLPGGDGPALALVNPLPVARKDVAFVGTVEGEVPVLASDVPPLGVKVVPWTGPAPSTQPPPLPLGEPTEATTFENLHYRIEIDPASASVVSLYDKALGREWADPSAGLGIGAVIYEEADRDDPHPAIHEDRRYFRPITPGPRFLRTTASGKGTVRVRRTPVGTTITMEAEAPYLPLVRTSVTLYDDLKCVDVSMLLDKEENYDMEGVYVAFPFAVDAPAFLMETANAVYQACDEQLPNTCRDWYSVQHAVGISGDGAGVLWASRQAPLVQLGEIRTGRWDPNYVPTKGHLYAWLMNNLYFTNFKAAQGGRMAFDFRLGTVEGPMDGQAVREWGDSFAFPLVALTTNSVAGDYRWLDIAPGNVQAQVLAPSPGDAEGYITLRLKETAGEATTAWLTWLGEGTVELTRTDLLESADPQPVVGDGKTFSFPVEAHSLVTLRMVW
jgi:hypothetical protein